jgi:hypothetical protein
MRQVVPEHRMRRTSRDRDPRWRVAGDENGVRRRRWDAERHEEERNDAMATTGRGQQAPGQIRRGPGTGLGEQAAMKTSGGEQAPDAIEGPAHTNLTNS